MNEPTETSLTLRQILLEQRAETEPNAGMDARSAEAGKLEGVLDEVPGAVRAVAAEQIVMLATTILDRRLVDLLMSGWRKWKQLVDAARRTLEDPSEVGIVELDDHEISWVQGPTIEVTYDGRKIADIQAEAGFEIEIHAVTAVVERGRLTTIRSGRADIRGRLSIQGIVFAEAEQRIDLKLELPLGEGIDLIEQPELVTTLPEFVVPAI